VGFDAGSFIGGLVVGGIAGAVFVGWNALKLGAGAIQTAQQQGWLNEAELKRDLERMKAQSAMARAYSTRARGRGRRSYAAKAVYGHGTGTESDLNRIPIYLG
jgi:hypothetical protein